MYEDLVARMRNKADHLGTHGEAQQLICTAAGVIEKLTAELESYQPEPPIEEQPEPEPIADEREAVRVPLAVAADLRNTANLITADPHTRAVLEKAAKAIEELVEYGESISVTRNRILQELDALDTISIPEYFRVRTQMAARIIRELIANLESNEEIKPKPAPPIEEQPEPNEEKTESPSLDELIKIYSRSTDGISTKTVEFLNQLKPKRESIPDGEVMITVSVLGEVKHKSLDPAFGVADRVSVIAEYLRKPEAANITLTIGGVEIKFQKGKDKPLAPDTETR